MSVLFDIAVVLAVLGALCVALVVCDAVFGSAYDRSKTVRRVYRSVMCIPDDPESGGEDAENV